MNINKEIVRKCIKAFLVSVIFITIESVIYYFYRKYVFGLSDEQRNQFELTFRIRYRYCLIILYGIVGYLIVKFAKILITFRERFLSVVFMVAIEFISGAIGIYEVSVSFCSIITYITALAADSLFISRSKNSEKDLIIAQAVFNSTVGILANWFLIYGTYLLSYFNDKYGYDAIAKKYKLSIIIVVTLLIPALIFGVIKIDTALYGMAKKNDWLKNTTYGIVFIFNMYFVFITLYYIVWTFPGILGIIFILVLMALYTLIFLIRIVRKITAKIIKKHQ